MSGIPEHLASALADATANWFEELKSARETMMMYVASCELDDARFRAT